jgi:hypothetical protein
MKSSVLRFIPLDFAVLEDAAEVPAAGGAVYVGSVVMPSVSAGP